MDVPARTRRRKPDQTSQSRLTSLHGAASGDEPPALHLGAGGGPDSDPSAVQSREHTRANPQWLREVLGERIHIRRGYGGAWEVVRDHSDRLLEACVERFGPWRTTVITDAVQQQKCGMLCQNGKPENALHCQCQCGGANHGGVGGWKMYGEFAIHPDVVRRVFKV